MRRVIITLFLLVVVGRGDFVAGSQSCPSSGRVQVSTTAYNLYQLSVSAGTGNTGRVYFGGSAVTTSAGVYITANGSYNVSKTTPSVSPSSLYMACTVNTDSVTWTGVR